MGVSCQIWINKPDNGVHKPGTPVRGVVKYFIDVPTEYQNVTMSLLGEGKCRWTDNNGSTSSSYVDTENYIKQHINIINKKPEDTVQLQPGAYEYPFMFHLPEDIPSSHKDYNSWITYCIQLKFVKPSLFSFNRVFASNICVHGFVDHPKKPGTLISDGPVIFGLEKALFAPFAAKKPVVYLKAKIEKTFLTPGENIHLTCTVSNHTDIAITAVMAELYYYTSYKSNCRSSERVAGAVNGCQVETLGVPSRKVETFTCIIPTHQQIVSIQNSKIISKHYVVRVTVRLPVPYSNATVQMPIVLGERRPLEPYRKDLDSDSQPPSYWEVMCEEKKEKA